MSAHLAVLAVLALATQPARGSTTLDLETYRRELDRIASEISAASEPDHARPIADGVPDRWIVPIDGQVITVDMNWLDRDVDGGIAKREHWPSIRGGLARRLAAMRADAADADVTGTQPPEAALEAVLARPEFHRGATSRWVEELRNRVANWLLELLNQLTGWGIGGRSFAMALAWLVSLLALGALSFWLVKMLTDQSRAAELEIGAAPVRTPAREWALRALAAVRQGDLREAVRCGYHAALCRLDEQGIWSVDESRTPREYLRLLKVDDPRQPVVRELTRQFEQIWYGHRLATMDDAQRMSAHLEQLGCVRASDRAI